MTNDTNNLAVIDPPAAQAMAQFAPASEPTIGMILASAVDRGMSPDGIEKLAAIYERELARQAERDFVEALAAFRRKCPSLVKNSAAYDNNGKQLYVYIKLQEITAIIDPLLLREGLTYTWDDETTPESIIVTCTLQHTGGHKRVSRSGSKIGKGTSVMSDPQKAAATTTFHRRYALTGVLGITADDDNDSRRPDPNPAPAADPAAPKVGTRQERAADAVAAMNAAAPTRVTAANLGQLFGAWKSKAPSPHTVEAFRAWVKEWVGYDGEAAALEYAANWSIELLVNSREAVNAI